jgi:hypothetical protein
MDLRQQLLDPTHHAYNTAMYHPRLKTTPLALCILIGHSHAHPAAYGICQASCAVVVAACYIANGAMFGTVRAVGASPSLLRCNTAYGTC